jgi:Tol biopolymer transport system component
MNDELRARAERGPRPDPGAMFASAAVVADGHQRRRRVAVVAVVIVVAVAAISLAATRRGEPAVATLGGEPTTRPTSTATEPSTSAPAFLDTSIPSGILVEDGADLVVIDPVSGQRTPVDHRLDGAWSPDRRQLAVVAGGTFGVTPQPVDVMRFDGRERHRVAADATGIAWSPDGTRLVYTVPSNNPDTIMVVNADGSGAHQVGRGRQPQWSADGRSIYANTLDESVRIQRIDLAGGAAQVLDLGAGQQFGPTPGPQALAFGDADRGLSLSDLDGSDLRPLVRCSYPDCFSVSVPVWSPDGRELAFVRYGTTNQLLVVSAATGNQVAAFPLRDKTPIEVSWTDAAP